MINVGRKTVSLLSTNMSLDRRNHVQTEEHRLLNVGV